MEWSGFLFSLVLVVISVNRNFMEHDDRRRLRYQAPQLIFGAAAAAGGGNGDASGHLSV